MLKEKQLIEKLLGILKKPKEQAEPQDLIDQLDLADRLYVKAYKKEDMIKELEERLKKIKPKLTDGIDEVGDGMDDR